MSEPPLPALKRLVVTSSDSASNLRSLLPRSPTARTTLPLPPPKLKKKKNPHRVLVLLTGGTMAMKANAAGALEPAPGYLASKMRSMGELRDAKMPYYEVIEYSPLLDSADMVPSDWCTIASDIVERYEEFDGFVVILGTDTLAFCASALSFMLQNLDKPVVLTGSMVPFCEAHSDGRRNLVMSLIFAGGLSTNAAHAPTPGEVLVFFHDRLLRGCRASKVDALALLAFDSPNFPPLATVGVAVNDAFHYAADVRAIKKLANSTDCNAMLHMETRIVVIRTFFFLSVLTPINYRCSPGIRRRGACELLWIGVPQGCRFGALRHGNRTQPTEASRRRPRHCEERGSPRRRDDPVPPGRCRHVPLRRRPGPSRRRGPILRGYDDRSRRDEACLPLREVSK